MRSENDIPEDDDIPEDAPPAADRSLKARLLRQTAVFGGLLLAGLVLLPILIYLVGQAVFGDYGGTGFADFYSRLHQNLWHGEPAAVFLLLSPCLLWLLLRLTVRLFRHPGRPAA